MSAFVVSRRHVAAVVRFAIQTNVKGTAIQCCELANMLMAENCRSVAYRYTEAPEAFKPFTLADIHCAPVLSADAGLKAVRCLDYQSCETPDWEATEACDFLKRVEAAAVRHGANSKSAGYDRAEWAINDESAEDKAEAHLATIVKACRAQ